MTAEFHIADGSAIALGAWHAELGQALREQRPERLELAGEWPDLSVFEGQAESVRQLKLAGTAESGKVRSLAGLRTFHALERLTLVSTPKDAPDHPADLDILRGLSALDAPWQSWLVRILDGRKLESAILRGFAQADLTSLPRCSSLRSLWLQKPSVATTGGISNLPALAELRITDAAKLERLDEIDRLSLDVLEIENAKRLADIDALGRAKTLRRLRLVNCLATVSLEGLDALDTLHVGGKDAAAIDWLQAMALPRLRKAFAWWEPARQTEAQIRAAAIGRRVLKFDVTGGKTRKTLFMELSD